MLWNKSKNLFEHTRYFASLLIGAWNRGWKWNLNISTLFRSLRHSAFCVLSLRRSRLWYPRLEWKNELAIEKGFALPSVGKQNCNETFMYK